MSVKKELNAALVSLFNHALRLEEKSLVNSGIPDLTISEIHVIEAIFQTPEKTMSNVANHLDVTPGTLTTSVEKLIKKGYVIKKVSKADKRIHLLQLTAKSIEVMHKHEEFHHEMIDSVLEGRTDAEVEAFTTAIIKINNHFITLK